MPIQTTTQLIPLIIAAILAGFGAYLYFRRGGYQEARGLNRKSWVERVLRRQLEELKVLHNVATMSAAAVDEDELIEQATQLIGRTVFPDNFGLMLYEAATGSMKAHASYHIGEEKRWQVNVRPGEGVTGKVLSDGRIRRVADIRGEQNYVEIDAKTRSEVCVPLQVGERVIGVINAESARLDAFTEADERLLTTIAGQLATAIERLRAETAVRRRSEHLEILYQASQEIAASLESSQVYAAIHKAAGKLMSTEGFVISLLDERQQEIEPVYFIDRKGKIEPGRFPAGVGLSGRVIETGEIIWIDDLTPEEDEKFIHAGDPEPIRSILAAPLRIGNKTIGMISSQSYLTKAYTAEHVQSLTMLANLAATAIQNAHLYEQTKAKAQQLAAVNLLAREMTENLDLETLYQTVCTRLRESFQYLNVSVFIAEEEGDMLRLEATACQKPEVTPKVYRQKIGVGVIGRAAQEGETALVEDTRQDQDFFCMGDQEILAELAIPLMSGERVIGVLNIDADTPRAFDEDEIALLNTVAGQFSVTLEKARLFEETRRRAAEQEALGRIIAAAAAADNLNELMKTALIEAGKALGLEYGVVWVGNELHQMGIAGEAEAGLVEIIREAGAKLARPVGVMDWVSAPQRRRLTKLLPHIERMGMRASVAAPVLAEGQYLGGLVLFDKVPHRWTREELDLVDSVGRQVGGVVERLQLVDEMQTRLREISFLSQIISITATEVELRTALEKVCLELAQFFQMPEALFAVFNEQRTGGQVMARYRTLETVPELKTHFKIQEYEVLGRLLEEGKPICIDRVSALEASALEAGVLEAGAQEAGPAGRMQACLLVPVQMAGEIVGMLKISSEQPRHFEENEVNLTAKVAAQIGQVLERLGLFAATREQAEHMKRLARLSEALNRPLTVNEVLEGIGKGGMELVKADRVGIYLLRENGTLEVAWQQGLSEEYRKMVCRNLHHLPGGRLRSSVEPILISDLEELEEGELIRDLSKAEGYRGLGLWPLVYQDKTIMMMGCYYDQPHTWSKGEQEVMETFSRQAVVAVMNARLFEETRQKAAYLEAMNAIVMAVSGEQNVGRLLEVALDKALEAFGLRLGGIWVGSQVVLRGVEGDMRPIHAAIELYQAQQTEESIVASSWNDIPDEHFLKSFEAGLMGLGVQATLTVPILSERGPVGGLTVASPQRREWQKEEEDFFRAAARQVGNAIERLELEQAIRSHAGQMRQIMDSVPEGVALLDADRNVLLVNPAGREYLRVIEGAEATRIERLASLEFREILALTAQRSWIELPELSGQRVFELAVESLQPGDNTEGWVLVIREVTQERENQQRIQMQERLATVGQLAAGIAHDFNNIMAAIVVYADLLKRDPQLPVNSRERVSIIQNQVQRAASLIRQILDFSRRSVMEQSMLDLLPFIKELDKLLGRVLPENIHIELEYEPGEYLVSADPTRLQQVFMNLAVNARDAMPEGGRLQFQLGQLQVGEAGSGPLPDMGPGPWVCLTVRDSGTGIAPDVLPHIFEPFFTTKAVGAGTGLGLAQAYGIVRQHDGFIDVTTQMGEGTSFFIYLPVQAQAMEAVDASEPVEQLVGKEEMILVVEDDAAARQAVQTLLEVCNYRVVTATNGEEALKVYRECPESFSMVVTDVVMPVMGGVKLYQNLKAEWPEVKVMFLTGHPLQGENQELLERGGVTWLQKPFEVGQFVDVVQRVLGN